jgi:formylglycine-generating enzyme required for sulfatase activity
MKVVTTHMPRIALALGACLMGACIGLGESAILELETSTDGLGNWEGVAISPGMLTPDGKLNAGPVGSSAFYRLRISLDEGLDGWSLITAGAFTMGSPDTEIGRDFDEVLHEVTLTRDFYMKQTEVTHAQVAEVMNWALDEGLVTVTIEYTTGRKVRDAQNNDLLVVHHDAGGSEIGYDGTDLIPLPGAGDIPCAYISFIGAMAYCNFLSQMEGLTPAFSYTSASDAIMNPDASGYRLPTDAEWEYACRAGAGTAYYTGDITATGCDLITALDSAGWYCYNKDAGQALPRTGALKQANAWGLYDMHGNLYEWCFDGYSSNYRPNEPVTDPVNFTTYTGRLARGGAYDAQAESCRCANRIGRNATSGHDDIGFRPVRTRRD